MRPGAARRGWGVPPASSLRLDQVVKADREHLGGVRADGKLHARGHREARSLVGRDKDGEQAARRRTRRKI